MDAGLHVSQLHKKTSKIINNDIFHKNDEIKSKFDVIYNDNLTNPKSKFTEYLRIPGFYAHKVLLAIMEKKLILNEEDLCMTRMDVKLNHPYFSKLTLSFDQENNLIVEFEKHQTLMLAPYYNSLKKPIPVQKVVDKGFVCVYVYNRKNNTRFIRAYVSKKKPRTFEVEFSGSVAKRFSRLLFSQNYFEFNKLLVEELIYNLNRTVNCEFTSPLHEWKKSYLEEIKRFYDFDEDLKLRKMDKKELELISTHIPLNVSREAHYFNYDLVSFLYDTFSLNQESHKFLDIGQTIMVLTFCTNSLVNKWRDKYDSDILQKKIGNWNWDQLEIFYFSKKLFNLLLCVLHID